MPIDYQQVHERIRENGRGAQERKKTLEERRANARQLLEAHASKPEVLRSKVQAAIAVDANIRCALPLDEPLDSSHPAPVHVNQVTLIAADGSQILPDRHAEVQFGLINVGGIVLSHNSGRAPEVFTDSQLLFEHDLYTETGSLTQEAIEFRRDLAERRKLLDLARECRGDVIALTDGPVEIWGAESANTGDYQKTLEQHKSIMSQLHERNVTLAGYVDKPAANLVIRSLEIAHLTDGQIGEVRRHYPLRGVTDLWLFRDILNQGERSSIFAIQSSSRARYTGILSLHFFYLNVGDEKHPVIVRIEIPEWVAKDAHKLDTLHCALIQQCSIMGARPYPYILHRAHETARVSHEDQRQITQMLQLEQLSNHGELGQLSGKQSAKNLPGRRRSQ